MSPTLDLLFPALSLPTLSLEWFKKKMFSQAPSSTHQSSIRRGCINRFVGLDECPHLAMGSGTLEEKTPVSSYDGNLSWGKYIPKGHIIVCVRDSCCPTPVPADAVTWASQPATSEDLALVP